MGRNQARIIPAVWLLTDERVGPPSLLRAAARLPRGAGIVLRHYRMAADERAALVALLRRIARRRGLRLLLAGPAGKAGARQADGVHGRPLPGERLRPRPARLLRTMPAHDMRELRAAERAGADAVFLSPLFNTRSHAGARPLGPARFAALARLARIPVLALGGIHPRHARLIRQLGASGYGAIDGLTRGRARQNLKAVPI